eukprot:scaffold40045_cov23-Cyclotella_meneghiniana.AAC.1
MPTDKNTSNTPSADCLIDTANITHSINNYVIMAFKAFKTLYPFLPVTGKRFGWNHLFHKLDEAIREAIVLVALEDAPNKTQVQHRAELESHARARCIKEELIRQKNDKQVTEAYIDALYYHKMYNSAACWKGDSRVISHELKKLTSNTAKYIAIKENIHMHVKGMGWEQFKHTWSKGNRKCSFFELAKHLTYYLPT